MLFMTRLSGGRGGRNGLEHELRRPSIRQKDGSRTTPRPRAKSNDSSAPPCALSYPRFSREELEGRFLGLMAYPDTER
jgi:hypothetical protein